MTAGNHVEVITFLRKVARKYESIHGEYVSSAALTADDLANIAYEHLLRYNRAELYRAETQWPLLKFISIRVFAAAAKKSYRHSTQGAAVVQSHLEFHQDADRVYTALTQYENIFSFIMHAKSMHPRDRTVARLLELLEDPTPYWQWANQKYSDVRIPTTNRLASFLGVGRQSITRAATWLKETHTKGQLA